MTTPGRRALGTVVLLALASCGGEADVAPDVIFVGGPILSPGSEWMPGVEAPDVVPDGIAVADGRVLLVGSADEVRSRSPWAARRRPCP